jgi:hypothetical protein
MYKKSLALFIELGETVEINTIESLLAALNSNEQ